MKIYTSYFYQVRFFKPHQIPLSTAVWDPKWYHNFKDQDYFWKDSNGVWNGLRLEILNPKQCHAGGCPCTSKDYTTCQFIREYKEGLNKLNFPELLGYLQKIADSVQQSEGFSEEPEIMLLVHEAPTNPCSERVPIQEYFKENGIEVKEWRNDICNIR